MKAQSDLHTARQVVVEVRGERDFEAVERLKEESHLREEIEVRANPSRSSCPNCPLLGGV